MRLTRHEAPAQARQEKQAVGEWVLQVNLPPLAQFLDEPPVHVVDANTKCARHQFVEG